MIKLRDKSVMVRCREIHDGEVIVELNGSPDHLTLTWGEEKMLP
jgi:hypothetical protein